MKKILLAIVCALLLTGCVETSLTDDLAGKVDTDKTVQYVIVSADQKDDVLYLLTGKLPNPTDGKDKTAVPNAVTPATDTQDPSEEPASDVQNETPHVGE